MKKRSKRYKKLIGNTEAKNLADFEKIIPLVKQTSTAKFDESIDLNIRINLKQSKKDFNLRTAVNLPGGTGKKVKIAVICEDSKVDEAKKFGADLAGGENLIKEINDGKINFDKIISTPSMMLKVGKLGKILGPKGLMPNPKLGTVTNELKSSINSIKTGQIEIKNDKDGNIGTTIGKKSFSNDKLLQNYKAIMDVVWKEKPSNIKGNYILSSYLTSTMGVSYKFKAKAI